MCVQGGTNFRVLRVTLKPGADAEVRYKKFVVDKAHMQGSGEELFDFLAQSIKETIVEMGDALAPEVPHLLGFTFSVRQPTSIQHLPTTPPILCVRYRVLRK